MPPATERTQIGPAWGDRSGKGRVKARNGAQLVLGGALVPEAAFSANNFTAREPVALDPPAGFHRDGARPLDQGAEGLSAERMGPGFLVGDPIPAAQELGGIHKTPRGMGQGPVAMAKASSTERATPARAPLAFMALIKADCRGVGLPVGVLNSM